MKTSRRKFMMNSAVLGVAGYAASAMAEEATSANDTAYKLVPIGKVEIKDGAASVRLFDAYVDGLLGLEEWSHVQVIYWFDKNDTPEKRKTLRVHPRGNKENPLTGVFACRSPFRPNLLALTVCRIKGVAGNLVQLDAIDAFDGTPVLDLKPFTPADTPSQTLKVPDWARGGPASPKK
jgi:tRNA-Thr(GGU) m(6)t(6)A37 methyltransferase TsaA